MNRALAGIAFISIAGLCVCSARNDAGRDTAGIAAANKWWQQALETVPVEKAGTFTAAHEIKTRSGKVFKIKAHVQTKAEEKDQLEDLKWANGLRTMVKGFDAEGF